MSTYNILETVSHDFRHQSKRSKKVQALLKWTTRWERCQRCKISAAARSCVVTGEGPAKANVLLIGEAPGAVETTFKRPFIGKAGVMLRRELIGCKRCEKIFITNILACRPPKNRDPLPEEAQCCMERVEELVDLLQPRLIVLVGRVAQRHWYDSIMRSRRIDELFVYHPAYLIRQGMNTLKDLKRSSLSPTGDKYRRLRRLIDNY